MNLIIPNSPIIKTKCVKCNGTGERERRSNEIILPCSHCNGSGRTQKLQDTTAQQEHIYFYIDQNIISEMREGTYTIPKHRMFDLSEQKASAMSGDFVIYVYSNETLAEILRTGNPKPYLDVLKSLKAVKLLEYIDIQNPEILGKAATINGKLQPILDYMSPDVYYEYYEGKINKNEEYLSNIVLFANTILHVVNLLKITASFEFVHLETKEKLKELTDIINTIRQTLHTSGTEAINYRTYENPVHMIWEKLIKPNLIDPSITEDIFFGFEKSESLTSDLVKPHLILNIIGYYPDKNNKIINKFLGFMSDMRHVNMALRTDVFLSYDNDLSYRAAALYKWENHKTGYNLMTVFKRFGGKDIEDYIVTSGETADQASDRSHCLYTGGNLVN